MLSIDKVETDRVYEAYQEVIHPDPRIIREHLFWGVLMINFKSVSTLCKYDVALVVEWMFVHPSSLDLLKTCLRDERKGLRAFMWRFKAVDMEDISLYTDLYVLGKGKEMLDALHC
jgi:hypothetical protein